MQISISTRHGQLNAETQERITEKMGKLPQFFSRVTRVEVTVDLEHQESPHVEARVTAEHTSEFVAADRASGGGPLRALAVVEALRPTIRGLLLR